MTPNQLTRYLKKETGAYLHIRKWVDNTLLLEIEDFSIPSLGEDPELLLTFDVLAKLSKIFGTKNINIGAQTKQDQYYPATYPGSITLIGINDITRWPTK